MNWCTTTIDNLTFYLSEINKFGILSADEEFALAIKYYEEKNLEAVHQLITANLRFVVKIANEYKNYGMKMLDVIQEGNIGLMLAVRKFNPYKGVRLISYAVWWIRAYIHKYIMSNWSLLKIGTTQAQRKLFFKLKQTKNAIKEMFGEDDLEIAALSLNVKETEIEEMEQRLQKDCSLNVKFIDGDDFSLIETLADDRQNQEELLDTLQEQTLLKQKVDRALVVLTEKERYVIEHRIMTDIPLVRREIAVHLSISNERVRQIEEQALQKLKLVFEKKT